MIIEELEDLLENYGWIIDKLERESSPFGGEYIRGVVKFPCGTKSAYFAYRIDHPPTAQLIFEQLELYIRRVRNNKEGAN